MKATLEFDMLEERDDLNFAIHGLDWALVALDIDNELRNRLKYGHQFKSADEALETVRDRLFEIMDDHNVNLDMIT